MQQQFCTSEQIIGLSSIFFLLLFMLIYVEQITGWYLIAMQARLGMSLSPEAKTLDHFKVRLLPSSLQHTTSNHGHEAEHNDASSSLVDLCSWEKSDCYELARSICTATITRLSATRPQVLSVTYSPNTEAIASGDVDGHIMRYSFVDQEMSSSPGQTAPSTRLPSLLMASIS